MFHLTNAGTAICVTKTEAVLCIKLCAVIVPPLPACLGWGAARESDQLPTESSCHILLCTFKTLLALTFYHSATGNPRWHNERGHASNVIHLTRHSKCYEHLLSYLLQMALLTAPL